MHIQKALRINRSEMKYELPLLGKSCLQAEPNQLLVRDSYSKNGCYSVSILIP